MRILGIMLTSLIASLPSSEHIRIHELPGSEMLAALCEHTAARRELAGQEEKTKKQRSLRPF